MKLEDAVSWVMVGIAAVVGCAILGLKIGMALGHLVGSLAR